jgi:hypothetical protein
VDVRITAKADSEAEADRLIHGVEEELRRRLKDWIYGADEDTLEVVALKNLQRKGWKLVVVEAGLNGELTRRLAAVGTVFRGGDVLTELPHADELSAFTAAYRHSRQAEVGLGVAIYPAPEKQDVHIVVLTPRGEQHYTHPYGGPAGNAPRWALHHSLDVIRNL